MMVEIPVKDWQTIVRAIEFFEGCIAQSSPCFEPECNQVQNEYSANARALLADAAAVIFDVQVTR